MTKPIIPEAALGQHIAVLRGDVDRLRMPAVIAAIAAIVGLLLCGGPSAISGFVVAVVVGIAVDGMLRRWTLAHVTQERGKVVQPFGAHHDAAAAVLRIVRMVLIQAAVLDAHPSLMLRRSGQAVRPRCFNYSFKAQAAARGALFAEVILTNDNTGAAITSTRPGAVTERWPRGFFENYKPSELLSFQIWRPLHAVIIGCNGLIVGSVAR